MQRSIRYLSIVLFLVSYGAIAAPKALVTHNLTAVESNAYVDGTIPSPTPSRPYADNIVPWIVVKIACYGRTKNNLCPAMIKMDSNSANPIPLGMVYMDLTTGDIFPKQFSANGYTFTVNGPAEVTLTQD